LSQELVAIEVRFMKENVVHVVVCWEYDKSARWL